MLCETVYAYGTAIRVWYRKTVVYIFGPDQTEGIKFGPPDRAIIFFGRGSDLENFTSIDFFWIIRSNLLLWKQHYPHVMFQLPVCLQCTI